MKTTAMKMILGSFAVCLAFGARAADPAISDVVVRQRWPWSRLVDIRYLLTCDADQRVDVAISASDGTTTLSLPDSSLSGDLYGVSNGFRRIVWDPMKTGYTNAPLTQFRVDLTPSAIPLYMIVDLTKSAGEMGQTEYVYESDLTNGLWGTWARNPVTNNGTVVESVVWTGVAMNEIYKTDKLVLRRVLPGAYVMGSVNAQLTKGFYISVFEVTQQQYQWVADATPSYFYNSVYAASRPVERISYNMIRGATNDSPAVNWPLTGLMVTPTSFLGKLRSAAGFDGFDLPTEAQWEYACRAGTTTLFNDGDASANTSGDNGKTNIWMNALGRCKFNGGFVDSVNSPSQTCSSSNGTATVGSYLPNAWGLYDTLGNLWEYCRDWYGTMPGGADPTGAEDGTLRAKRGGGWDSGPERCVPTGRSNQDPSYQWNTANGFRIVRVLL